MKLIGITQRVVIVSEHSERRDCLDQKWSALLHACGFLPYQIPNYPSLLQSVLKLPLQGILFTGGNTLHTDAKERDQVEQLLLEHAVFYEMPLLGVCRGMQCILEYFGSHVQRVEHHVGVMHDVVFESNKPEVGVNSYHEYGTYEVRPPLKAIGRTKDGIIEAIEHENLPIHGIMWHPERNCPFIDADIDLLRRVFSAIPTENSPVKVKYS